MRIFCSECGKLVRLPLIIFFYRFRCKHCGGLIELKRYKMWDEMRRIEKTLSLMGWIIVPFTYTECKDIFGKYIADRFVLSEVSGIVSCVFCILVASIIKRRWFNKFCSEDNYVEK